MALLEARRGWRPPGDNSRSPTRRWMALLVLVVVVKSMELDRRSPTRRWMALLGLTFLAGLKARRLSPHFRNLSQRYR